MLLSFNFWKTPFMILICNHIVRAFFSTILLSFFFILVLENIATFLAVLCAGGYANCCIFWGAFFCTIKQIVFLICKFRAMLIALVIWLSNNIQLGRDIKATWSPLTYLFKWMDISSACGKRNACIVWAREFSFITIFNACPVVID